MSDNSQSVAKCRHSNYNVKITDRKASRNKTLTYFCIVSSPVAKRKHGESLFYLPRLLQVPLYSLAMKSTECEFGNGNLRGEDLINRRCSDMLINTSTMAKKFNPSISIENIAVHVP